MPRITIYTTRICGYCSAAKRFFASKGWSWEEVDLTEDPDARADLYERTGRPTVPQIWINDEWIGGYDDLRAADRDGRLARLVA